MLTTRSVISVFGLALTCGVAGVVAGQDYPNKPIRIITANTGGSSDFTSRLIAPGFSTRLGQPVIVENRPGVIADEAVSKAPPDGYTLLVHGTAMWIGPLLQKANYDPVSDFLPISLVQSYPTVLLVHPSLPVKSVKELIALAKARPGELNYGMSGIGGGSHLPAELFKSMAGVNIVRVNFKGAGFYMSSLIAGEIQVVFTDLNTSLPHTRSGRLRALAVGSAQRSVLAPDLPTVAASGLPGYETRSMNGLFAPAKTSVAIINRLNQEIVRVINQADVKESFLRAGSEAAPSSPEEFAAMIKVEMATMGKVIKDSGIRVE